MSNADRKKFISEDSAQQGFMSNFFSYGGLTDYYERLEKVDPCAKNREAVETLKQPIEAMVEKLPGLYKCNPDWPICLFDFSFRNLNPKFVAFRVKADLNSFILPNYFSRQKLCDPMQPKMELEREK